MAIRLGVAIMAAALLLPAAAHADQRTVTLRYGPLKMGRFNVTFPRAEVPTPGVDGYVVGMSARLVDARGRAVTIRDVMLHHVVFFRRRALADPNDCEGKGQEAFYGTGEENETLRLPPGYGYPIARGDSWSMHTMLMSHSERTFRVYVQYRVTVVTGTRLTPVKPYWVRASGCHDVTYPVWGGGAAGSTALETSHWKVPIDGRIVAVGGHLHGGAKDMYLTQPACGGRRLLDTAPRYGMPDDLYYRVRPILHEPGPVETRYFLSRTGIGVRRGETLDITGDYDDSVPHPRVMAIMHVYIAPGSAPRRTCAPLPADRQELLTRRDVRTDPPTVTVPLNVLGDDGHTHPVLDPPWPARTVASGTTIHLRDFAFKPVHVQVKTGSTLKWSFDDAVAHNLTFANGPRLIRGPTASRGAKYATTLTVPGRYELFCYLHPLSMHEVVDVTS